MGLERGAELVPGRVRCGLVPLLHEEVLALELELRVLVALSGVRMGFAEQVFGGARQWCEPIWAYNQEDGGGKGIMGEVGPVLREGSQLEPGEGQAPSCVRC